jgi:hypothetical protein
MIAAPPVGSAIRSSTQATSPPKPLAPMMMTCFMVVPSCEALAKPPSSVLQAQYSEASIQNSEL